MTNPTIDGIEVAAQSDVVALQAAVAKLEAAPAMAGVPGPTGPAGPQGPAGAGSTQAEIVAAVIAALGGSATAITDSVPVGTGSAIGSATDVNKYPLAPPAVLPAPGTPVQLGTGPDTVSISLANTPGVTNPANFAVEVNGVVVAGPFTCNSYVGESVVGAMLIEISGPFGQSPSVNIVPEAPNGTGGLFVMAVSCDLAPLYYQTAPDGTDDSRGSISVNQPSTYNSDGAAMYFGPAVAAAPAAPAATATTVNGSTLAQLLAAGTPLTLAAGTIVGSGLALANVTGVGIGQTIIDGTNFEPYQDKALLVVGANGIEISQLTVRNAAISQSLGFNAAGLRNNDATIGIHADTVELTGNQNGILTDGASVGPFLFNNMNIHGNGATGNPGDTHNMYIGGTPAATCTLSNSTVQGCIDAHEYKSRCGTTVSENNKFTTGGNGSCIDAPNGGILNSTGDSFTLPATAADENFITFAMENSTNVATLGQTVTITNGVFNSLIPNVGGIIQAGAANAPAAILILVNCTYTGSVPPTITGFATVNGTITKAS